MGFPRLLANKDLLTFICDYGRLIIIGNAKTHEIEALMDEELETLAYDRFKPVHAIQNIADSLPALGIVAAVLGIVHAMGSLDASPEILGGLIGAALVGTFSGILLSYAVMGPIAIKIKSVRQKQLRLFTLVKQSLLAFMNGAMPQVAVEFGRKTIPSKERPTIDTVESEMIAGPAPAANPLRRRPSPCRAKITKPQRARRGCTAPNPRPPERRSSACPGSRSRSSSSPSTFPKRWLRSASSPGAGAAGGARHQPLRSDRPAPESDRRCRAQRDGRRPAVADLRPERRQHARRGNLWRRERRVAERPARPLTNIELHLIAELSKRVTGALDIAFAAVAPLELAL